MLGFTPQAAAQNEATTYNWISSSTANAWLSQGNWNNGATSLRFPGTTANLTPSLTGNNSADVAFFNATLPSTNTVGINMNASGGANQLLSVGAIQFANNSNNLAIGNSSATSGTLQMNGASLFIAGFQTDNVILYNGSTSAKSLTIQNTIAGGASMGLALAVNNAVIHANTDTTINISNVISETGGSRGITFSGQGTLVLSAANTYTGGTTVSQGTLRTANTTDSATGNGTVTVASGATLSGTGTVVPSTGTTATNTVTVNGTLRPGTESTPGTLSVGSPTANATVSVNDTYTWSLSSSGSPSSTPGGSDAANQSRVAVEGNLTFTPTTVNIVALNVSGFDSSQSYSWRVATATGNVSIGTTQPTFNVTGLTTGSGAFFLSMGLNSVFVNFSPVPEPTSILLVCGAAAAITHRMRRRRQHARRANSRTAAELYFA